MSALTFNEAPSGNGAPEFLNKLAQRVQSFIHSLRHQNEKQQKLNESIAELEAYSDKELNDLGLSRTMIRQAVTFGLNTK